jgi:hypothetical protein
VASPGAAEENWRMVADEFAAAAGENRRPTGQACPLLLGPAGRRTFIPATVLGHAAPDLGAASPDRLTRQTNLPGKRAQAWSGVLEMPRNGSFSRLPINTTAPQTAPELETGATKNNLVDLEGSRVYKDGHPGG